ncbi:MAG: hypothetical protein JRC86_03360 [Deltaproteobacteria bacterium]|nr:hypothetical protein [Deltaproteobacteria bacterium]
MAKERYGMLEMEPAELKRLNKLVKVGKPIHEVDPEIKEIIKKWREGKPSHIGSTADRRRVGPAVQGTWRRGYASRLGC